MPSIAGTAPRDGKVIWAGRTVGDLRRQRVRILPVPRQYAMTSAPPSMPPRCAKCATPAWEFETPSTSSSTP